MKIRVALTVMLLVVSVAAVLDGTMASGATVLQGHMTGILSTYSVGSVTPLTTFNLPPAGTSATLQPTQSLPQPETSFAQTVPTIPITTFFTVKSRTLFTVPVQSTTTTSESTPTEFSTTTIVLTTSTTVSTHTWGYTSNTWGYDTDTWGYGCNYWNGCYDYTTACSYYGCYYSNCYYNSFNCYNQPPTNCYPGYPNYPYCSPNYAYPGTPTTTATAYSLLTETSTTTQTTVSTPNPLYITNTLTTATTDTTMETLYGSLMAIFLVLFLATLFLLARRRSESKGNPLPAQTQQAQPQTPQSQRQAAYVRTSYKCGACGNEVLPKMKFCGDCGAELKREADT